MKSLPLSLCLAATLAAAGSPASAQAVTLSCAFSDFDPAEMKAHLANVVPERSTHEITDSEAINRTTGKPGLAKVGGAEINLVYRDKVRITGEIIVEYKIKRATGMTFVRTRALRPAYSSSSPEMQGVAVITGTCHEG
ncbi:MAG: hypothetical protein KDE03_04545 [Rhodobacteraceae bacterium]|nr:hypothetical protein [Paracoccaceae bacterium]